MGVDSSFAGAFGRAMLAAGMYIPDGGQALISVRDRDRRKAIEVARELLEIGFKLVATRGTARSLKAAGIQCAVVNKVLEGRPHIVDLIKNGEVGLIVNTTEGRQTIKDSYHIRREALYNKVTYTTTMAGAKAICMALRSQDSETVRSLRELHAELSP